MDEHTSVYSNAMQPKAKEILHNIWPAEVRGETYKASMRIFYDYPIGNWQHIKTTNPIEPVFAAARLRAAKTKNCGSQTITQTMAFKLMETAQKKWFRLVSYQLLADIIHGVKFVHGD